DLARQPAAGHRLLGHDRAQDLERDRLPGGVAGHEHDAHPALADPFEKPVRADPLGHLVVSSHGSPNRLGSGPEHRTVPSIALLPPTADGLPSLSPAPTILQPAYAAPGPPGHCV